MDGLERIIGKIDADAEQTCASIISEAERKAAGIIAEAEASAAEEVREIITAAEAERDSMIRRAHSAGELAGKKFVLAKRVEIIDRVIDKAVQSFLRDEPEKYFAAMMNLFSAYMIDGDQEMIFNDRDLSRLPADFEDRIKGISGGRRVTVRGGGSFSGGFLLVSKDVVENCTIEALISDKETDIRDELYGLLFTE